MNYDVLKGITSINICWNEIFPAYNLLGTSSYERLVLICNIISYSFVFKSSMISSVVFVLSVSAPTKDVTSQWLNGQKLEKIYLT